MTPYRHNFTNIVSEHGVISKGIKLLSSLSCTENRFKIKINYTKVFTVYIRRRSTKLFIAYTSNYLFIYFAISSVVQLNFQGRLTGSLNCIKWNPLICQYCEWSWRINKYVIFESKSNECNILILFVSSLKQNVQT